MGWVLHLVFYVRSLLESKFKPYFDTKTGRKFFAPYLWMSPQARFFEVRSSVEFII